MHPFTFIKAHPAATVILLAAGMVVGPAALNFIGDKTGVGISLPTYGK
jgi:hypothetical protein